MEGEAGHKPKGHNPKAYLIVAIAGLAVDAGVFLTLSTLGLGVGAATATGYAVALVLTYLCNERWSFGHQTPSWARASIYVGVAVAIGLGRALLAHALFQVLGWALLAWALSVGVSFVANYLLLKKLLAR